MDLIKPKALKKGDTIGVFAPSSYAKKDRVKSAQAYLIDQGYKISLHPQVFAQDGNLAGTDRQKTQALNDLFADDTIDAIFCARGGNGLLQYIDEIDYDLIRHNPKPVIGFSDVTVLHHALLNKANMVSFHGPIFQYMKGDIHSESTQACLNLISGGYKKNLFEMSKYQQPEYPLKIIQKGCVQGRLIGGNLTLLSELTKTSNYKPQFANNIVFFEDTENYAYKHERQLASFFLNDEFKKVRAIIIGVSKINPDDKDDCPKHPRHSWEEMMLYFVDKHNLDIPIIINAPIMHGEPNQTIPHGVMATLDATGDAPTLKLLESPFAL